MNYQTFRNLQFGGLLKNSSHSIRVDLPDVFLWEVSVGSTPLILIFKKLSDVAFVIIPSRKIVASNTLEPPYYKAFELQKGRRFGASVQVFGRIADPLLRKYVIPFAKRVDGDFSEFTVPEMTNIVSGNKSF